MLQIIITTISVIATFGFSQSSFADLTFGKALNECIRDINFDEITCDTEGLCTSEAIEKKAWPCLDKMNIRKSACKIRRNNLKCDSPQTDRIFSNTSGCLFEAHRSDNGKIASYLYGFDAKPCKIDGVEIESTVESARVYSDVTDATLVSNRTWKAQKPVIAYGFEKTVPVSNITVLATHYPTQPPWDDSESSCTEPTFAYICGNLDDGQSCEVEQTKLRKKVGLEGHADFFPQRHYVGRNGPKSFPVVREFKLKKATKICSVLVPKDTVLTSEIDDTVCSAMTDGAIRLNGFPIALFPALQKPNVKSVPTVMCSPRASETSNIVKMARPEAKALPALNWQECVCHLDPTYFE